jgi:type IX secretion system PorP/SprF family membrane protein
MRKLYFIYSALVLIGSVSNFRSQDHHLTQFYTTPTLFNPATAGVSNTDSRFVLNYKNQWRSVVTPYNTFAFAYDSKIYTNKNRKDNKKGGLIGYGINAFQDKAGLSKLTTNQVNLNISYSLFLNNRNSISAGFVAGFFQKSLRLNNLKWDSQFNGKTYDSGLPTKETAIDQSLYGADIGCGLVYKTNQIVKGYELEVGGSLLHLNKPNISFYDSRATGGFKYVGHAQLSYKLNSKMRLLPSALYSLQNKQQEVIAGANLKYFLNETSDEEIASATSLLSPAISGGLFYRHKDAIAVVGGFDYNQNLTIGISYDVNISKLRSATNLKGGFEISLIYTQRKHSKIRTLY